MSVGGPVDAVAFGLAGGDGGGVELDLGRHFCRDVAEIDAGVGLGLNGDQRLAVGGDAEVVVLIQIIDDVLHGPVGIGLKFNLTAEAGVRGSSRQEYATAV